MSVGYLGPSPESERERLSASGFNIFIEKNNTSPLKKITLKKEGVDLSLIFDMYTGEIRSNQVIVHENIHNLLQSDIDELIESVPEALCAAFNIEPQIPAEEPELPPLTEQGVLNFEKQAMKEKRQRRQAVTPIKPVPESELSSDAKEFVRKYKRDAQFNGLKDPEED